MLSSVMNYLAHQARKPTGWFGRLAAPLVFSHENSKVENFGLELIDPQPGDHILEIGFGHGRLLSKLAKHTTEGKVCGIDISRQMVSAAASRNREWIENGKVELQKASIADIPYPDNRFEKVFTCNTIYFWPDPSNDLREVKRVLNAGGRFLCAFRDRELMRSKGSAVTDNRDVFQNLYHAGEVEHLFESAGFQNISHYKAERNSETIHAISGNK